MQAEAEAFVAAVVAGAAITFLAFALLVGLPNTCRGDDETRAGCHDD
jgi:hypothetical protein